MAPTSKADLIGNRYGHLPFRRRVITVSSASTRRDLDIDESGAFMYIPAFSSAHIRLPRISSLNLGLTYDLVFANVSTAAQAFVQASIDTSALIQIPGLTSNTDEDSTIVPITSGAKHLRVTAVSSIIWAGEPIGQVCDMTTNAIQDEDFENGSWTSA